MIVPLMKNDFLVLLKTRVLESLRQEPVKIILFGSRASGKASPASDVDLAIIPYGRYNKSKITRLRDQIEEMNIPYYVDLVNFDDVSDAFKQAALKGSVAWKD
jgi:predicted nucleotidyltransferase